MGAYFFSHLYLSTRYVLMLSLIFFLCNESNPSKIAAITTSL
ncbi:hypothetical protein OSU_1949 [Vibrio cholerae PS15]|nr:hypothetical protein OSU_1949 [Vibrio cholerae PS15]